MKDEGQHDGNGTAHAGSMRASASNLVAYAIIMLVVGAAIGGLYAYASSQHAPISGGGAGGGNGAMNASQVGVITGETAVQAQTAAAGSQTTQPAAGETTAPAAAATAGQAGKCYTVIAYMGTGQTVGQLPGSGYSGEVYAPNSVIVGPFELCVVPGTPVSLREGSRGGNINTDFIGWLGTGAGSYTGLGAITPPYTSPNDAFEDAKFFTFQNYTFTMPADNITEEAFFGSPNEYMCLPANAYAPGNALASCSTVAQYYLASCEGNAASGCPQDIGSPPTIDCGSGFNGVLCFNYGAIPADDPTGSIEMPPFVSNSINNGCFPSGLDGPYEGISNGC